MIQVGANEEMAIRMKFNEIYLDLKVYLYIGRRRGSIRGGRPREKSLGKRVIHDVIRGGSIADSGWQDTSYYSWIFSPETEQFRYHSSKQRKVYDACTRESIMERRPKWTIFSPFFNEGGREKAYGGERASGGKRRRRKVVEEAPRISISTTEYYTRLHFI